VFCLWKSERDPQRGPEASVSRPSHGKPAGVDRAHGIAVNVSNPPRNFPFGHFGAIIAKNVSRIEAEARRLRRYPE